MFSKKLLKIQTLKKSLLLQVDQGAAIAKQINPIPRNGDMLNRKAIKHIAPINSKQFINIGLNTFES